MLSCAFHQPSQAPERLSSPAPAAKDLTQRLPGGKSGICPEHHGEEPLALLTAVLSRPREGRGLCAAQPAGHPGAHTPRVAPGWDEDGAELRGVRPYRESGLSRTRSAWSSRTLARRQRCSRAASSRVLHSRTVRSSAHDARYLPLLLKSRQHTEPLWPCGESAVTARGRAAPGAGTGARTVP